MATGIILLAVAFGGVTLIGALLLTSGASDPIRSRVQEIRDNSRGAAPQLVITPAGLVVTPGAPSQATVEAARRARMENHKPSLRDRLVQAGLYRAYSPATFAIVRGMMAVIPLVVGIAAGMLGIT